MSKKIIKKVYKDNGELAKIIEIPAKALNVPKAEDKKAVVKKAINRKSLPRLDPKYLDKIAEEAKSIEQDVFFNSIINSLKEQRQRAVVNELDASINVQLSDNPLHKYKDTKEFKKAKSEFYYETIYQIIDLRVKLFEKIKAKHGENAAEAFMFSLREPMKDIWYSDGGNSIELEYAKEDFKRERSSLDVIKNQKEQKLSKLPKVGYGSICEKDELSIFREESEESDLENMNIENIPSNLDNLENLDNVSKVSPIRKDYNETTMEYLDNLKGKELINALLGKANKEKQ